MAPKYYAAVYIGKVNGFTYIQNVENGRFKQDEIEEFSTKVELDVSKDECESSWKWSDRGDYQDVGDNHEIVEGVNYFAYTSNDLEYEEHGRLRFKRGDDKDASFSILVGEKQFQLANAAKLIMKGALRKTEAIITKWRKSGEKVNWRKDVALWVFFDGSVESMSAWKNFMEKLYKEDEDEDNKRQGINKEDRIDFGPVEYQHISSVYAWKYLNEQMREQISCFKWMNKGMAQPFMFEYKREVFEVVDQIEGRSIELPNDIDTVSSGGHKENDWREYRQYIGEVIRKEIVLCKHFIVDNKSSVELCLIGAVNRQVAEDKKKESKGKVEIYPNETRKYWEMTTCLGGNKDRLIVLFYSNGWKSEYQPVVFDFNLTTEEKEIISPNQKVVLSIVPRRDVTLEASGGVESVRDRWRVRIYFSDLPKGKNREEKEVINKLRERMYTEILEADPKSRN